MMLFTRKQVDKMPFHPLHKHITTHGETRDSVGFNATITTVNNKIHSRVRFDFPFDSEAFYAIIREEQTP
jgi:hypothetical protein